MMALVFEYQLVRTISDFTRLAFGISRRVFRVLFCAMPSAEKPSETWRRRY